MLIQELWKEHNKFEKDTQDEVNFWIQFLISFENELEALDEKKSQRISEMNGHLQEIRNRLSANYFEQFDSPEDAINELQEVANRCLDELTVFESQIFNFHQELNNCIFRVNINKMVTQVLQKTTQHYFDETGEFEYRGSHYNYFRQHGVTLGLALTTMTLMGFEGEYEDFYNALLHKVENLGHFPENPVESQILNILNSKIDLLFDSDFDHLLQNGFKIG
ncbi:MAG: hypothetical protein ACKPCI_22355 [Dolichospermum sp.]